MSSIFHHSENSDDHKDEPQKVNNILQKDYVKYDFPLAYNLQ